MLKSAWIKSQVTFVIMHGKTAYEFEDALPGPASGLCFFLSDASKMINPMAGVSNSEQKK
jgi:hypothetical protein